MDSNTLRRILDKHGNLQRNTAALDEVEGIVTASSITIIIKAAKPVPLRVVRCPLLRAMARTVDQLRSGRDRCRAECL
jgi:hypothetical protein